MPLADDPGERDRRMGLIAGFMAWKMALGRAVQRHRFLVLVALNCEKVGDIVNVPEEWER
jgi:hypothetical protein